MDTVLRMVIMLNKFIYFIKSLETIIWEQLNSQKKKKKSENHVKYLKELNHKILEEHFKVLDSYIGASEHCHAKSRPSVLLAVCCCPGQFLHMKGERKADSKWL